MGRKAHLTTVLLLAGWLAPACAASHAGRTVGRGVVQGSVGVGGPLVTNLGPAVPIPSVPVGVRYGVTDRLDVAGSLNVLPIVFGGFLGFDAGFTWGILRHEGRSGPNLASGLSLMLLTDFRDEARLLPIMDIAGGYTFRWFTAFAGLDVVLDAWGGGANLSPFVGFELDLPRRVILHAAFKWFAVNFDTYSSLLRSVTAADRGMMGFVIGVKFGFETGRSREEGGGHED